MNFYNILLLFVSIAISKPMVSVFYNMLLTSNCISINYKNKEIPIGMGLPIVFTQTLMTFILSFILETVVAYPITYTLCILMLGFVGFIDDIIGEKSIKGFKGHIRALMRGKLTTGGLKAVAGFITASFFAVILTKNLWEILINIFLIALFTNLINLFDLRPGRSIKVFIAISLILIFSSSIKEFDFIIYSIIGIIIVYFPLDIKGRAMMGDTGSNVLGFTLGSYCAYSQSMNIKLIYLAILISLHIISEFYSFSNLIGKNKILSYLDNLGR